MGHHRVLASVIGWTLQKFDEIRHPRSPFARQKNSRWIHYLREDTKSGARNVTVIFRRSLFPKHNDEIVLQYSDIWKLLSTMGPHPISLFYLSKKQLHLFLEIIDFVNRFIRSADMVRITTETRQALNQSILWHTSMFSMWFSPNKSGTDCCRSHSAGRGERNANLVQYCTPNQRSSQKEQGNTKKTNHHGVTICPHHNRSHWSHWIRVNFCWTLFKFSQFSDSFEKFLLFLSVFRILFHDSILTTTSPHLPRCCTFLSWILTRGNCCGIAQSFLPL